MHDVYTDLEYADQRYYVSGYGRFSSADPLAASAMAGDPGSWNRYSYVGGDPINNNDPSGMDLEDCSDAIWCGGSSGDGGGDGGYAGLNPCYQIGVILAFGDYVCGVPPIVPIPPPPVETPVPPSCDISVSISTQIGEIEWGATPTGPPSGKLGSYQTEYGGVYLAVQIQGTLYGDTDPDDWEIGQAAAAVTVLGEPIDRRYGHRILTNNPDLPAPIFTYSIPGNPGQKGWADNPGLDPVDRLGNLVNGEYKFFFTSSLTLSANPNINCDVQWGFDITTENDGATWSLTPWGTN